MKMKKLVKKSIASLLALLMVATTASVASAQPAAVASSAGENASSVSSFIGNDYAAYKDTVTLTPAKEDITLQAEEITLEKDQLLTLTFNVAKAGAYRIGFDYLAQNESKNSIELDIAIDGEVPFDELSNIVLARLWKNDPDVVSYIEGKNDRRPTLIEDLSWQSVMASDAEGHTPYPFEVYFSEGQHTVTITNTSDTFKIKNLFLCGSYTPIPDYEAYLKNHGSAAKYKGETISIQAENFATVNSRSLIASNDMSDAATFPSDYSYIKLNTLGGTNWRYVGNTATWKVEVPASGLYQLAIRFRQTYYNGISTHRLLRINGEVPFKEAEDIAFDYGINWQLSDLDGKYVYLEKGENVIALEAVLGDNSNILGDLEDLIYNLNTLYRKIITITGTTPDIYRDYALDKEIPDLIPNLKQYLDDTQAVLDYITSDGKTEGNETVTLKQIMVQMEDMLDEPASITKSSRLNRFKSNISSLGTWANKLREQPLEIDVIALVGEDGERPREKAGFFEGIVYRTKRFFASFVTNYSSMDSGEEDSAEKLLHVWVSTGRDQAQLLKNMVEDTFTPTYNTAVSVELVSGGLIEAILAGRGPDVALDRGETDPVNYAMRNALIDLSQFDDFEEVTSWFCDGSMIPFEYEGGYYGIPVTQGYEMMFYRTDIFEEYGIQLPETWEDLILYVLPVLQANNMQAGIGVLTDCTLFKTLLYQYGGNIYSDDYMSAALDTQVAYESFKVAVDFYKDYDLPQSYDFMNRFRTGEMPLAITSYLSYNTLKLAAPELNGVWEMVCIPGVRRDDGTINNTQIMSATAAVITKNSTDPQNAWNFLKWFVSADVQGRYGADIESILGAAGRYNPSNMEAMTQLSWGAKQLALLEEQRSTVTCLPNLPGSYFTGRAISNAFVSTVLDSTNPRESLLYWNEEINFELERKREEFNFDPTKHIK